MSFLCVCRQLFWSWVLRGRWFFSFSPSPSFSFSFSFLFFSFLFFSFLFFSFVYCLLPTSQYVRIDFLISCFISFLLFGLLDLISIWKKVGLRLGSSITGSMHSRTVLDIYLGCRPARVKVFSGLFEHFFPLMYCLACSCNYTNWERSPEFLRLLFWVMAAIWFGAFVLLACKIIYSLSLVLFVTCL